MKLNKLFASTPLILSGCLNSPQNLKIPLTCFVNLSPTEVAVLDFSLEPSDAKAFKSQNQSFLKERLTATDSNNKALVQDINSALSYKKNPCLLTEPNGLTTNHNLFVFPKENFEDRFEPGSPSNKKQPVPSLNMPTTESRNPFTKTPCKPVAQSMLTFKA